MDEADHRTRRLRGLDDPDLPPGLWPRVEDSRRRLFARRRRAGAFAAAAVLAVGLVATHPDPEIGRGAAPGFADDAARPVPTPVVLQVRAIDRELQAAYLAGADPGEIDRLWRARDALLAAADAGRAVEPLRI